MKKRIYFALVLATASITMAGCAGKGSEEATGSIFEQQTGNGTSDENKTEGNSSEAENKSADGQNADGQNADGAAPTADDGRVSIMDETTELDYSKDYTEETKVAVERAVASASSFDEEFQKMTEIQDHITSRRSDDQSQAEMNMAAFYYYQVWDVELNNLWDRFSNTVDAGTKERVLADQRNWNAMKEDAALEALGPQDQGGSIYPVLYNSFMEESTKARCYALAKEIAAVNGRSFTMPKKAITGSYIDSQGTDSIYSSLSVTESWESGYIAKASLYRLGEIEGTAEEAGDGTLTFTSYDETVKATIHYGWDGATFEVTEVNGDAIVSAGEKYEFPLVF